MAPDLPRSVRVWDLPLRLFHWLLALLVAFSVVSGKLGGNALDWHRLSGYAILTLLLFRIGWGFAGSTYARFGQFLRGPGAIVRHLAGSRPEHPGHNPLGALSVLAMLTALLLQAATGLFANDGVMVEGPLYKLVSSDTSDFLTAIHGANAWVVLGLVALHLAAILFYLLAKKENLVRAMITGRKQVAHAVPENHGGSPARAAALLAGSAVAVWWVVSKL